MSVTTSQTKLLFQSALAARNAQNPAKAATLLLKLIAEAPTFAPAYTELGLLLASAGQKQEGTSYLEKAVELAPLDVNCIWALADFYRKQDDWTRAHACFERAAELAPANLSILKGLLNAQRAQQDYPGSLQTVEKIIAIEPGNTAANAIRGETLDSLGRSQEALLQFEALLNRPDSSFHMVQCWARLMLKHERAAELIDCLKQRLASDPRNMDLLLLLSFACFSANRHAEAAETLQKAYQLQPDNMRVLHDMGVVMRFLGKADESNQWFERVLKLNPFDAHTLRLFGEEHKYQADDTAFIRLGKAFEHNADDSLQEQAEISYALGKAYDDIGDYETAFQHYIAGGKAYLMQFPLQSDDREDERVGQARELFSRQLFQMPSEPGYDSKCPVFVLGMPRSGTSLIEQILASHPEVFGAGEQTYLERAISGMRIGDAYLKTGTNNPFFADEQTSYRDRGKRYLTALSTHATGNPKRIIDKMPENFLWAGTVPLILPQAKIIHCRRHPVEICLSAFRNFFVEGHLYSYDLAALGRQYRRYDELMTIWRSTIPDGTLLEIRYEDIIFDFEKQVRRLTTFIELEWHEECLNFHRNTRAVLTASALQVRKPLYQTSTNRWRKYAPYIKPLLDELGSLVQQYESELENNA